MNNQHVLPTAAAVHGARAHVRRWGRFPDLLHFAFEYLLLLPIGAVIALIWANTYPEIYFPIAFDLDFFVTDVAMVLFFGVVTKEVVEATAHGGVLHPWRRVALPGVAAVGMTLVPAVLLYHGGRVFGEPMVAWGWPATFGIDLAVGYFAAVLIFGRHPVVPLFLALGLASNALGFAALAPKAMATEFQALTMVSLMAAAIAIVSALRGRGIRSFWPYLLIGGGLSWSALTLGGVHPALALVPIVPFMPGSRRDPGFMVDAPADVRDTRSEFERWCRPPAQVALLLFGFITAGVPLRALDWGALSLPLAILIGKPLGLLIGVAVARVSGFELPRHVGWRELTVVALLATIGFTMALFFATVAIGPGPLLSELKVGALWTVTGALLALAAARLLRVGRFAPPVHGGARASTR
jgi:NhaA family Na+:H+ antiporter